MDCLLLNRACPLSPAPPCLPLVSILLRAPVSGPFFQWKSFSAVPNEAFSFSDNYSLIHGLLSEVSGRRGILAGS